MGVHVVPIPVGAPMFYPIPNAPLEGPDHMITSNEGELWVRRNGQYASHDRRSSNITNMGTVPPLAEPERPDLCQMLRHLLRRWESTTL